MHFCRPPFQPASNACLVSASLLMTEGRGEKYPIFTTLHNTYSTHYDKTRFFVQKIHFWPNLTFRHFWIFCAKIIKKYWIFDPKLNLKTLEKFNFDQFSNENSKFSIFRHLKYLNFCAKIIRKYWIFDPKLDLKILEKADFDQFSARKFEILYFQEFEGHLLIRHLSCPKFAAIPIHCLTSPLHLIHCPVTPVCCRSRTVRCWPRSNVSILTGLQPSLGSSLPPL